MSEDGPRMRAIRFSGGRTRREDRVGAFESGIVSSSGFPRKMGSADRLNLKAIGKLDGAADWNAIELSSEDLPRSEVTYRTKMFGQLAKTAKLQRLPHRQ
jgi:hypothetical protein